MKFVAPREVYGGYYLRDVHALRDNTKIGETVKFKINRSYEFVEGEVAVETIKGKIASKYPHVFMLEDGRTYSWVDYALGRQI